MLKKRTYSALALALVVCFPTVASAAGDADPGALRIGVGRAGPAPLSPLTRPVERFHRAIRIGVHRIRAARRARLRRERREALASLPGGISRATLESIAACESGGDPSIVSSDGGYRGKYQFSYGTWASVGGSGDPAAAPEPEQDYRAALLYARSGSSPWPVCG